MTEEAEAIALPSAATLNELWLTLGFGLRNGGVPSKKGSPYRFVTSGQYRRLDAGIRAFQNCGFTELNFRLDTEPEPHRLHFVCEGEPLSPRRLYIATDVTSISKKGNLICSESQFTIHGRFDSQQSTRFTGGPLDGLAAQRINAMLVVIGARHTPGDAELLASERVEQGSSRPLKAWQSSKGRLTLLGNSDDGSPLHYRAQLRREGDTTTLQARLRRIGWDIISGK